MIRLPSADILLDVLLSPHGLANPSANGKNANSQSPSEINTPMLFV
jgi:hypothetical protein